jgi:RimJ/RimL family protein N-acetyltransferase
MIFFGSRATAEIDAGPCRLRPWRLSDAAALARIADNAAIAGQLRDRFPHPYQRSDARDWLRRAREKQPVLDFAVVEGDALVGAMSVSPGIDVERVSAEIGYWIAEPRWNRGLATAALRAAAPVFFATLRLTRLFALPFAENAASCRVLEKAGFVREGVLRRSAVKNGAVRDQILYARTDRDPPPRSG